MKSVLILNGPNLNLLGTRQPEVYGSETLQMVEATCRAHGEKAGIEVVCFQSNHEGALLMLDDATIWLAPFTPSHQGVAVEPVLQTLAELRPLLVGLPPQAPCPIQPFVYRKFRLTRAIA